MNYEYSKGYEVIRFFERLTLNLHYRKIVYTGLENINENHPIIFASNHRNAVVDPFLLLNACKKQPVFLARADVFKKPAIARIMTWLHIMPVYRLRDGAENLENNNESFQLSGELLKKRIPMALYPEGKHNPKLSLLPIQKAISRIVLPIEASENFTLGTEVIPVGLYYSDIFGFLSDAYVTFGKPIRVVDYKQRYEENPGATANFLRKELEVRMKELIVNIWNDEFYDEYVHAIDWNAPLLAKVKYAGKKESYLLASQEVVRTLDEMYHNDRASFDTKMNNFREADGIFKKHGLTSKDNVVKPSSTASMILQALLLVVSLPVTVFGFINGIFPILGYKKLLTLFKDNQFIPTVRVVSGMFIVPVFVILQSLIVGLVFGWWWALAYFFVMPLAFYFACWWRKWVKSLARKWKVNSFVKKFPDVWSLMRL
ncbi:1-acyl-sn-glycerol-3-phosphate acyltransferase [Petrimonas sp.]|uniref:1-acyl-sn-glycerol-3-phosphate acyltransferase n=1 Tax=Petrimonas sp. TaxID=2023866 RepID=UPI003F51A8DC